MPETTLILGDRYELGRVLGRGGMARVHEGRDRQLDRPVAVKVLESPFDRDDAFLERFRREAHAAARLNHPNIVAVYDSGSDDGTHFIVAELVHGETLADVLRREDALPPDRAVAIAREVAHALEAAHARGVVHRDVKPGNVMITRDGGVKVVDFGIARASGATSVTRTGFVMGSASYLSPEQAQGGPGDERSDIYALGCVLYQMLTGRPPFVADTPVAALYQHVNEPVPSPSGIRPVPEAVERVVLRALAKDPADRFGSVRELEGALDAALDGGGSTTIPLPVADDVPTAPVRRVEATTPGPRRRRPFPWAVVGAVALGILVVAALAMSLGPVDPKRDARQAARDAARTQGPERTEEPSTIVDRPTVDGAHAVLVASIVEAESTDQLDGKTAGQLVDTADEALEAYAAGDVDRVQDELARFQETLAEAVEEERVSVEAADAIRTAFGDLVLAVRNEPAVEEPVDGDDDGGGGGETGGDDSGPGGGGPGNGGGPGDAGSPGNSEGHGHGDG